MLRYRRIFRRFPALCFLAIFGSLHTLSAQTWVSQQIQQTVPGLWSIAMTDTGRGIAAGGANPALNLTGVVRKLTGNPTWQLVPTTSFTPALAAGFPFWSASAAIKGTGTAWVAGSGALIYKTTDYGATWNKTTTGVTGSTTFFDIFFKNTNEGLAVGGSGTAYYTTDGGATWTVQTTGVTANLYAAHSAGSNWYITGANNTFLKFIPPSTWTSMNIPSGSGTFSLIEGLQFLNDQIGTLCGYNSSGPPHVLRTTDGGASWAGFATDPPLGGSNYFNTLYFFNENDGWVANVFDPVAHTTDKGATWTTYSPSGSGTGAVSKLDFLSQQDGWASGGALGGTTGFILRYNGPAPAPNITTTLLNLDFGTLECASSKDTTFTIRNTGTAPLVIDSIRFMIPEVSLVSPSAPFTIAAGGQQVITVRWTPAPTFAGSIPAAMKMQIYSNDVKNTPWDVMMAGVRNYVSVSLATTVVNFGDVCRGATPDVTVTATPSGNLSAEVIGFTFVSGDNAFQLFSPILGVKFKGALPFYFRFVPVKDGVNSATFELRVGNPNCPQVIPITLSGRRLTTSGTLTPAIVDFGEVCAGAVKDVQIDLSNTGNTALSVLSRIHVLGTDLFPDMHPTGFGPVAVNATAKYNVRFAPSINDIGPFSATYKLILGPCPDTLLLTLQGRAIRTNITSSPSTAVSLGPITVGQTQDKTVTFSNSGSSAITASGVRLSPSNPSLTVVNAPTFPITLNPGQNVQVTVRFTPTVIQTITAQLCLMWTLPCPDSLCLYVSASSSDPPSISTVASKDFGVQQCPAPVIDSIFVRNGGPGPLSLLSFDFSGPQKNDFTVIRPLPPVLVAKGDSIPVVIRYNASVEGPGTATLTIQHNDAVRGNKTDITLTGSRVQAEFYVEGDTTSITSVCAHELASRSFVIRTRGSQPVQITSISVLQGAQSWKVTGVTLPATLQPGQSLPVTVTFRPFTKGTMNASIMITSQPCTLTYLVTLQGEGRKSDLSWIGTPVNFGTVDVGSSQQMPVSLKNNSGEAVTVTAITMTPSNPALTLISPPPMPLTLQPGSSASLTLQYAPTSVGSLLVNFCAISSTPCADTICTMLQGLGRSEGLSLDADRIDLHVGGCAADQSCDTVRIVNNSPATVTVTGIDLAGSPALALASPPGVPLIVPSGRSQVLRVCARPYFTGTASAVLTVRSDDVKYPVISVPVTAVRDSVAISLSTLVVDAGNHAVCEMPLEIGVVARNTGDVRATMSVLRAPGAPFALAETPPASLNPGEEYRIRISVTAASVGGWTDSLVLALPCGETRTIVLHASVPASPYSVSPDPLAFGLVAVGSSSTKSVTVSNGFFGRATVSSVRITPAGPFTTTASLPAGIDSLRTLDIPVRYAPTAGGDVSARLCVVFSGPCPDSICVDLSGSGAEGGLMWAADPLAFGTHLQCETTDRADTLINGGSLPVTLTGSTVSGAGQAAFTVTDPVTANEQLASGARRVFHFRFNAAAAADGAVNATLRVATTNISQPSIDLALAAVRQTQVMPAAQTLAFGTVTAGSPSSQNLSLTNNGTATLILTRASLPAYVQTTPALPQSVLPGQTLTLSVSLTAPVAGPLAADAVFHADAPCPDSTVVHLTADALPGVTLAGATFGVVPSCTTTDRVVRLTNSLATGITVDSVSFTGADRTYFSATVPGSFPASVAAGSSLDITVRLTPALSPDRVYNAVCVAALTVDGARQQVQTALTADAREARLRTAVAADFGNVSITAPSARTFTYTNSQPFAVTIASVTVLLPEYTITATRPSLPAVITPGATLELDVTFAPGRAADFATSFRFVTSDPCAYTVNEPVSGRGVDDIVRVTLKFGTFTAAPDAHIIVPLELGTDLSGSGAASYAGRIAFNRSMLYPVRVYAEGSKSAGMNVTWTYDPAAGAVNIGASGANIQSGTGPLLFVEFQVLIGDDVTTALSIDTAFAFTSGKARVESRQNGTFTLEGYCLGGGNRLIRTANRFALLGNAPNPFNPSTVIEYELDVPGVADLAVHDMSGRIVAVIEHAERTAGVHRVVFDASGVPSGVYLCVLRHEGRTTARAIVLAK